jgi:hypothetical protein
MKKYYKVLGYDRKNNEYYNLSYTSNKSACLKYLKENGWLKEDIRFITKFVFLTK